MPSDVARVVSWAWQPMQSRVVASLAANLGRRSAVEVGRERELPVGVHAEDMGVSREALTITLGPTAWRIAVWNRRGASLHPRGGEITRLRPSEQATIGGKRIGIRIIGDRTDVEHWILLECDGFDDLPVPQNDNTYIPAPPDRLTNAEIEAVTTVFAEYLAWPPNRAPQPLGLETAGRRMRSATGSNIGSPLGASAVRERLRAAQIKAQQLGADPQVGVTLPNYVFVLVAHGYLPLPHISVPAIDVD